MRRFTADEGKGQQRDQHKQQDKAADRQHRRLPGQVEFQRFDAQKAGPDHQKQLAQQQPQQRAGEDG
ncbi:hypothetical protein D3C73_1394120 [compost metagenome]